MNILILGYGLEGKSTENYFKNDPNLSEHTKIDILDNFTAEDLKTKNFEKYDLIFRTPSVRPDDIPAPAEKITSVTKFFFSNCKGTIIGVTGTKGKGTTCTLIHNILAQILNTDNNTNPKIFLLGNIGSPALDALPEITEKDIVVYELSSFQLWDLKKSPKISVALRIEPDHLDVHKNFDEYLLAKENIAKNQTKNDYLIYFKNNENTSKLAKTSPAKKLPYPIEEKSALLKETLNSLKIPGDHNKENAEAALLAISAYFNIALDDLLKEYGDAIKVALKNFQPLPHHIEFVRELSNVRYFDDSFSTVLPSLEVAIKSFPKTPLVLIAGGKNKGFPLEPAKRLIFDNPYLIKTILIGETGPLLAKDEDPQKYYIAGTDFEDAVKKAQKFAEAYLIRAEENSDTCLIDAKKPIIPPVVLLSPCASSFDMFKSYKDRGNQFKNLVESLKEQ